MDPRMEPCSIKGCPRIAAVAFKISVPARGFAIDAHEPITMILGLKVCQRHFDSDAPKFLAENPELGELVATACRAYGKAPPDMARAWLTAVPLESPEFLQFEKMNAGGAKN